jgi:hypothetical protein
MIENRVTISDTNLSNTSNSELPIQLIYDENEDFLFKGQTHP